MYKFFNFLKFKIFFIFLFFLYGAFIVYFSLFTYGPKSDLVILGNITVFDKFIHIFVYMLWPFFILFFFKEKIALIIIFCLIFSLIVEYLQIYTDRNFQILDIRLFGNWVWLLKMTKPHTWTNDYLLLSKSLNR